MVLRLLTPEEMVTISAAWVMADEPGRKALAQFPLLAALLPELERVHQILFELKAKEPSELAALRQREAEVDAKHDAYVHILYDTLTVIATVAAKADELLKLRDRLFPEGLLHVRKSYRTEVGHAAFVASQADDALRAKLKAVALHESSLLDYYDQWQAAAQSLAELEDERARLMKSAPSVAGELYAARQGWIRVVKLLVTNAEAIHIDAATDELLFSALRATERAARARLKQTPAEPSPSPSPQPAA